jgi:uncharacterized Fe-S cluster-containing radical SAM superfamily enzyme
MTESGTIVPPTGRAEFGLPNSGANLHVVRAIAGARTTVAFGSITDAALISRSKRAGTGITIGMDIVATTMKDGDK